MATRPVAANIMAIALSSENDSTLRIPETVRCTQFFQEPNAKDRPCDALTISSAAAPSPSVTTRILNGGTSSRPTRIAGQVRPQQKLSATSISLAVVSVVDRGA